MEPEENIACRWELEDEIGSPNRPCQPLWELDTRVNWDSLLKIDQLSETFKAHIFIKSELRFKAEDFEKAAAFMKEICNKKRLTIENVAEDQSEEPVLEVKNQRISLSWVIKGEFGESLELQNFPFDTQDLTVTVRVGKQFEPNKPHVCFKGDPERSKVVLNTFLLKSSWRPPHCMILRTSFTEKKSNVHGHQFPLLHITIWMRRIPWFYIYNVVVPMCSIVSMSACSLSIPPKDISGRLSASLTLVLTAVAYKYVVAQMVPTIGYNTLLDWYVLTCWCFLGLVVLENCLCDISVDDERKWGILVFAGFASFNLLFVLRACYLLFFSSLERNSAPKTSSRDVVVHRDFGYNLCESESEDSQ